MKIEISKLTNQDKVDRKMPKVKFNSFSNMKIEINENQPLDEVVMELERLGFKRNCSNRRSEINIIVAFARNGFWCGYNKMNSFENNQTTLAELKEM